MPLTTQSVVVDLYDLSGGWVPDASQFSLSPNELLEAENVELDYRGGFRVRAGYTRVSNPGVDFCYLGIYTHADGDFHLMAVDTDGDLYAHSSTSLINTGLQLGALFIPGSSPDRWYDVSFTQLKDYLYVSSLRGDTWRFDGFTWLEITDSTLNGGGTNGTPEFPRAKSTLALHNRVFAANIIDGGAPYRSRIAWSTLTAGADQYAGNRWEATSFIDVQENDGGEIQAIHPFQSNIIIFKDDALFVLSGDDNESFSIYPADDTVGTTVSGSIASDESVLFFLDPRSGVYGFDGVKAQRIDEQINNHLMEIMASFAGEKLFAKGWIEDTKYFLVVGQVDGNRETFVFDMRYQAWTHWSLEWADIISYKDVTYMVGQNGISTFRNRAYLDDDAVAYTWTVKTAWIPPAEDQEMRQYRLRRFDIASQWVTGGEAQYTFNVYADNDDSTPVYTQTPDGDKATERMPGYNGLVHRYMMEFTGVNSPSVQTDRRITGISVKMSARPSKGSFGAGLDGPTSAITETRNHPGLYWRLIDVTYAGESDLNVVARPDGGENGDHMIVILSRDSAFEIVADSLGAGWTRDTWDGRSLGDSRGIGVFSKKVTDWATEPTTITASDDGWGIYDNINVLLVRGLAPASHYVGAQVTDHQGVLDDFVIASTASSYKNMVIRTWFAQQDVADTNGRAALLLEQNGYLIIPDPHNNQIRNAEIYLHDARGASATTGTFAMIFNGGGGPEITSYTVVYAQA